MPDTNPPAKSGTRRTTAAADPAPLAEPAVAEPEQAPAAEVAEEAPDTSGWYRNGAAVELLVQPTGYPSALLKPGGAVWLPSDPQHPDLKPCDPPAPEAVVDDTTGSEK